MLSPRPQSRQVYDRARRYSSPPVRTARSFSAISSFVIAVPISGCSPIFSCSAFRIW